MVPSLFERPNAFSWSFGRLINAYYNFVIGGGLYSICKQRIIGQETESDLIKGLNDEK